MDTHQYDDSSYRFRDDQPDNEQVWQTQPSPKKEKGWTPGRIIALTLCASLLSGALGAGGAAAYYSLTTPKAPTSANQSSTVFLEGVRENAAVTTQETDTASVLTPAQVYAQNVNSTVGITTSVTTNYWGYPATAAASGSGFILSADGYILTNYHVIENSDTITVSCYNGDRYDAELVGYDESNDIAVLKVNAQGLSPVVLGSSKQLNVGDSVVAIGNPLGELTFSLTAGAVSALNRQVTLSAGHSMELIQTDCAINSGNSGGALFNLHGEVVGITNAKYSSSSYGASIDNIGFAIPIDDVRSVVQSIIEKGYVSKPYIGVSVVNVSAETQSYGLPQGAAVRSVAKDSPAQQAGLQEADIITHVNGAAISSSSELVSLVSKCAPRDKLQLNVYRRGEAFTLTLTVGEQILSPADQNVYRR